MGKELEMFISLKDRNGTINNSVKGQNTPTVVNQNATSIDVKSPENLQRQPQEDNFNGKGLDKKENCNFYLCWYGIGNFVRYSNRFQVCRW